MNNIFLIFVFDLSITLWMTEVFVTSYNNTNYLWLRHLRVAVAAMLPKPPFKSHPVLTFVNSQLYRIKKQIQHHDYYCF